MSVLTPLRRLGVSVVALGASAVILAGCGSSTSGTPLGLGAGGNSDSVGVTSAANGGGAATATAVAPGAGASSVTSSPTGASSVPVATASVGGGTGGSNAAFCQQLSTLGADLSSAGDPSGAKAAAEKFRKLANAAPSDIKPDLQKMADFLESVADGKLPDASTTANYSAAAQRVIKYLTTACI